MKINFLARALLVASTVFLSLAGFSKTGEAAAGYSSSSVFLRSGPGTGYPIVARIAPNNPVEILGCIEGWLWCDVDWNGNRGWVSGPYLRALDHNRRVKIIEYGPQAGLPIVVFEEKPYWDKYYHNRRFYRHHHWDNDHDHDRRGEYHYNR